MLKLPSWRYVVKKILVCDDAADNCLLLQTILEIEGGCYVEIVSSGAEALTKIDTDIEPPDLLILGVMIPEINGYEVAQRIRQSDKFKALPILLITGFNRNKVINDCGVQIEGVIQKPYNFNVIITQVLAILSK